MESLKMIARILWVLLVLLMGRVSADELRWMDIVNSYKIYGGTSGYQLVVEVDMQKLPQTKAYKDDPYWFQYYRSFWRSRDNRFVGDVFLSSENIRKFNGDCKNSSAFYNYLRMVGFTEYGNFYQAGSQGKADPKYWDGPFYDVLSCAWANGRVGMLSAESYIYHTFVRKIDDPKGHWFPGTSTLGPNYYQRGAPPYTLNFKIYLNDYVELAPQTFSHYKASYWKNVRAGEVNREGFGIVPLSASPSNRAPNPFFQWVYIIPKGEKIRITDCQPGILGCPERLVNGGDRLLHDPPLWGPSEQELLLAMIESGQPMGLGEELSSADFQKEGFYSVTQNSKGEWIFSLLTRDEAWDKIQKTRSLTINGSGNGFQSGMHNGRLMAESMGLSESVHYYLPQPANRKAYETAKNLDARNALAFIYSQSQKTQTMINLQSHSWGAYLAFSSCKDGCSYINQVSYAPATLPYLWPELADKYKNWQGQGHIVYSSNDVLSHTTFTSTQVGLEQNHRMGAIDARAGHGLQGILRSGNFSQFWR